MLYFTCSSELGLQGKANFATTFSHIGTKHQPWTGSHVFAANSHQESMDQMNSRMFLYQQWKSPVYLAFKEATINQPLLLLLSRHISLCLCINDWIRAGIKQFYHKYIPYDFQRFRNVSWEGLWVHCTL